MSTASNPLAGWNNSNINVPPPTPGSSPLSNTSPISVAGANPNPGNLANPNTNIKDITRNTGNINNQTGADRNALIPQFAQLFGQYGSQAADFFKKLMDLGGPFYQQQQQAGFTQGVQQNQNAGAMTRQQINASGTGATPSGAGIAAIAGANQQGGQSLAEQFLQNLFQNENLQSQGGQALAQLTSLFNPSQLTGQSTSQPGSTQGPNAATDISSILGSIFGSGGVNKDTFTGGS